MDRVSLSLFEKRSEPDEERTHFSPWVGAPKKMSRNNSFGGNENVGKVGNMLKAKPTNTSASTRYKYEADTTKHNDELIMGKLLPLIMSNR